MITWNLNAGRGDLPRLVVDVASGRLTGAPPEHVVLLLQETAGTIAGAYTFVVPVYEIGGRLRANAIVSTLPLLDTRAIALPRERQPRMAALATIMLRGERLFVVSTHLENRLSWLRGGVFSDAARLRQAAALIRVIPDGPGILGGDLNTSLGPAEPALKQLAMRFPDTPPLATPTFRQRLALDHLFFDLPDGWRADVRVLADRYGSDHHPVIGVVTSSRF